MTARSAFAGYKTTVLEPIIEMLSAHLLDPLLLIVIDYMDLPCNAEEHFKYIVSIPWGLLYSHEFNMFEHLEIRIILSSTHSGVDILAEYDDDDTTVLRNRQLVDPPVQSLVESLRMFDVSIALAARIRTAISGAVRLHFNGFEEKIIRYNTDKISRDAVSGFWKKYKEEVDIIVHPYLCSNVRMYASESDE